ncbi:MAG: hypothetical protein L7U87_03535 [Chlamydiales bacterium]|nr:hypothetical protein [Chlamydiales bacterium]
MLILSKVKVSFQDHIATTTKLASRYLCANKNKLLISTVALLAIGTLTYSFKRGSSISISSRQFFQALLPVINRLNIPGIDLIRSSIEYLSSHKDYSLLEEQDTYGYSILRLNEKNLPKVYGCNCQFSSKENRALIENKIIEHLVKAYPDVNSEIPLAFLGAGGMLSEFLIVEKLRTLGYYNFNLTFIDILYSDSSIEKSPEIQEAMTSTTEYLTKHTNSKVRFKSSLKDFVNETSSGKTPYNAIAIDYDTSIFFPLNGQAGAEVPIEAL